MSRFEQVSQNGGAMTQELLTPSVKKAQNNLNRRIAREDRPRHIRRAQLKLQRAQLAAKKRQERLAQSD